MFFTPASLGYLSQFILALLIAGYFIARLLSRRAERPAHRVLLTGFFVCIALLTLLLTLEAALPPSERWDAVILQTPVLFLGILLLQQFAYRFPQRLRPKWDAGLAVLWSLWHFLDEATAAIDRFQHLAQGAVRYRGNQMDVPIALGLLWVVVVLLRQSLAASARQRARRPQGSLLQRVLHAMWRPFRDLWRPQGQAAATARALMLVYLLPFGISLLTILRSYYGIPQELLQMSRSLGIMIALAAFAIIYLNYLPETTSFMVRLVGATLVTLLTVLAAVGWLVTPAYAAQYRPVFPGGRTLRFTPNAAGGYDLSLAPFYFERDVGASFIKSLPLDEAGRSFGESQAQQDFVFPFFGQTYDRIFANLDGTIALGRNVGDYSDYSYHYGSIPLLMPLLLDLAPEETGMGDALVRQEADRLIVTWDHVPGFYRREAVFTFQAILYRSGIFEFSYDGLPAELPYRPDDEPSANVWVIGAVPGTSPPAPLLPGEGSLTPPSLGGKGVGGLGAPQRIASGEPGVGQHAAVSGGPTGLVQDYYLDFREHLHTLLLPLVTLILGSSLLLLLAFPWLFRLNLVKPLEALLAGVRRANAGDLNATTPVQFRDEIGFLTESFNTMTESLRTERDELQNTAQALRELSASLETRVADRTRQLSALYDISSIAEWAANPDILLKESLVRTMPALQCAVGAIWLMDEKRAQAEPARLRLVAQHGFPPTAAPAQMMTSAADGLFARMAAERQPVLVTDLAAGAAVSAAMAGLDDHTMLIAPLCAGEQVLGVIGLLRGNGQAFREGERALLANIASQLGSAVESQRLRRVAERSALLEERQRLARDLHDSVTQSLYSVTLFVQALRSSLHAGNRTLTHQYADKLGETAQQALKEMRWLIYELRPALVEELGLVDAVRRRLETVERRSGVGVEFSAGEIGELDAELESAVYQIAQEALTNTLKHAAATFISVQMGLAGPDLQMEIADNGKGFDLAAVQNDAGFGLASMRERAERLGGSLAITSKPGRGTRIRLTVPVQPGNEPTT